MVRQNSSARPCLGDEQCSELPTPALKPAIPRSSACVKYRRRARGHSPPPNSHFAMNSSATKSCRWHRPSERATPSRAWTLPPSTACGSSWTASAAQGCRSTRSSATHHLPHSILRIWRSESTIHTTRGEGVGLAWEHKPMPSFHQTTACISLFFECSSRGSILQKLHHTDGTWKPVVRALKVVVTIQLWYLDIIREFILLD